MQWSVVFLLFCSIFNVFAETQNKEDVLKVALSRAPITLDARYATDAGSIRLLRILSGGLVRLDENFVHQSNIALSYKHEHFQKFTFTLADINFSDGEKLTSKHIRDFYESIMQKDSASPLIGSFKDVIEIKTPTNNVVEFYLSKPNPWFLTALETPIFKINTDKRIENPVGLSSNKFIKKTDIGDVWIKQGNRTIKLQVIKDPTVKVLKLMRGEIDVIYNDLPDELLNYTTKNGYRNARIPSASYTYMGFNLEGGITANAKLRKALAYAVNRQKIMDTLLGGNASPAQSLLLDSHPAVYKAKIEKFNPKKAIKILEEIGYKADKNGERLALHMSVTTNPFVLRIAQIIQQQLKAVGIKVTIASSEWGSFYGNIKKGNFESYILTWVGRFQPDIFHTLFHSSMKPPHGANRGRYDNPKMDMLLDIIKNDPNQTAIQRAAVLVQTLQDKEKIYLPLWRRDHAVVMAKNITGCKIPSDGGYEGLLECLKK
jgi:peptide/nickel transport system substrate-binding protein